MLRRLFAAAALLLCCPLAVLADSVVALLPGGGTFPQGVYAHFAPDQNFAVYSGPGEAYLREAEGKASVSTNDWIEVFGEEDGWLLVLYRVNADALRFGYIQAAQAQAGVAVQALSWQGGAVALYGGATNDPIESGAGIGLASGQEGTMLAMFGDDMAYVETRTPGGVPVRAFVRARDVVQVESGERLSTYPRGVLYMWDGADVALYATKEDALFAGTPVRMQASGVMVRVVQASDGAAQVAIDDAGGRRELFWIDGDCLVTEL